MQIADFFIDHLPDDFVPPSDFDLPLDEENGRDAAAAAIACSGLFELSEYAEDDRYRQYADSIMLSLCSPNYLAINSDFSSILKRGQVRYTEPEKGLIYADAFFLEAILKYKGLYTYFIEGEGPINFNPIAKAGRDQTVTDSDQDGLEIITLDASASKDPDDSIALYEWKEEDVLLGTGEILVDTFAIGIHHIALVVTDKFGKTGTDSLIVTIVADLTGNFELLDIESVHVDIFPNPVLNGELKLKLYGFDRMDDVYVELYDISGKQTYHSRISIRSESIYSIKLDHLPNGMYILRISNKNLIINKKIIL